ncbi:hypothetical protein NEHOM01_0478 [Nematocida homosporus]|uniref:uncharacterized protein n=1 Tax=Nematocida homosporus TaxID=1912981 RepID=UPI002221206D|nr:uncharacterized protein NEHOM01_0478 [Nematocida homosporus]KAI5184927.1 hypothetical protein NEHOM01_0478 [Nematocida homosporus]
MVRLNLRMAYRLDREGETESEGNGSFESWKVAEREILSIYDVVGRRRLKPSEMGRLLKGLVAEDSRERELVGRVIAEVSVNALEEYRSWLVSTAVEYLVGEIEGCLGGLAGVLGVLNRLGVQRMEVLEVYLPLLGRSLTQSIRLEIVMGVRECYVEGVDGEGMESWDWVILGIRKLCREFLPLEMVASLYIIENIVVSGVEIGKEAVGALVQVLEIGLRSEHQRVIRVIGRMLEVPAVQSVLGKYSGMAVKELFATVYRLSQVYWKRDEQAVVCGILEALFCLNNRAFDVALQEYNRVRYEQRCKLKRVV